MKIGCCGWGYLNPKEFGIKDWKKKFRSKLACYASLFDLVEVNSTFYKLPKVKTAKRWLKEARGVNKKFEFTIKANQIITHIDKFGKRSLKIFRDTSQVARALDSKIILIQTPRSLKDDEVIKRKVVKFFSKIKWDGKLVIEPRGFSDEFIKDVCKKFDLIHCVDPFAKKPLTKGLYYFRLHGKPPGKRMYYYRYTEKDLKSLRIPKNSYVLFNNIWMYESAMKMKDL